MTAGVTYRDVDVRYRLATTSPPPPDTDHEDQRDSRTTRREEGHREDEARCDDADTRPRGPRDTA